MSIKTITYIACCILIVFIVYPEILSAKLPKVKIVLSPLRYLKESDVEARDEILVRKSLRKRIINSNQWNVSVIDDSSTMDLSRVDRNQLRLLGIKYDADFVISGQMDVIDEDNWAISFEVISSKSTDLDTTFNADPSSFKMKGELDEIIQAGFIEKMHGMIQSYILSVKQKTSWWKKSQVLIAGSMLGTITIGYIVTEILHKKKHENQKEEKNLPVSPDPPQ